jgi:hypothetical protein
MPSDVSLCHERDVEGWVVEAKREGVGVACRWLLKSWQRVCETLRVCVRESV